MREDYLEQLEKMFPNGFILIYPTDTGRVRCCLEEKKKNAQFSEYIQVMQELISEGDQGAIS